MSSPSTAANQAATAFDGDTHPTPPKTQVTGPALTRCRFNNTPNHIQVKTFDAQGQPCTRGGAVIECDVEGADNPFIAVTDHYTGEYSVCYKLSRTQPAPGTQLYVVIKVDGEVAARQGPLRWIEPSRCTVTGTLLTADPVFPDQPDDLVVTAVERLTDGGDDVSVRLVSLNEDGRETMLEVRDNTDGTYSLSHTFDREGRYRLHVMVHQTDITGSPFDLNVVTLIITNGPSETLTDLALCHRLYDMLPADRRTLTLQHSSKNGNTEEHFWGAVQGQGRILVVARNPNGNVFGGYVEDTFDSTVDDFIPGHASNFIFRLTGDHPVKLLRDDGDQDGVWMDPVVGFTMGGGDLRLFDPGVEFYDPSSYRTAAPGYTLPDPLDRSTLPGLPLDSYKGFTPEIMEIFQCS